MKSVARLHHAAGCDLAAGMAAILLVGAGRVCLQLPVSALPWKWIYPIIQVITFYPGASPDVMASAVTAPLERQFEPGC